MTDVSSDAVAGRWFGVAARTPRVGVGRRAWQVVTELVTGLVTLGLTWGEFDPRRSCVVSIYRRDTGQPVAEFAYTHLSEASMHVPALWERLQSENVFDFCRDIGIEMAAVSGGGQDKPQDVATIWTETRG